MQEVNQSTVGRKRLVWLCGLFLAGMTVLINTGGGTEAQAALPPSCTSASAKETDGIRRLALVVGVGKYKSEKIPSLRGPAKDAQLIYSLLTGPRGYEYPKENVCLLVDEQATMANFRAAFEQALVNRARPKDAVVIYFAGHGSQVTDLNGDEGDGNDETLIFHDSSTPGVPQLIDDEFSAMLERLHDRTQLVTLIVDSCNSRTVARGDVVSLTARYVEPETISESRPTVIQKGRVDGSPTFSPKDLPGLVVLSAAKDGTPAFEAAGQGIFTNALYTVLKEASIPPLTYDQALYQVRSLVKARSEQIPDFHGDLTRIVFANETRKQTMGMRVDVVNGEILTLSGPPLPGLGINAEMRVYDGRALVTDTQDPQKAKGTLIIKRSTGLKATARVSAEGPGAAAIRVGDLAVLVRPADAFLKLTVRLRSASKIGGIPIERATAIQQAIQASPETQAMVVVVKDESSPADFELSVQNDQKIVLRDGQNRIRREYDLGEKESGDIAINLWQHARQIGLYHLRGEGGRDFKDDDTLRVSLVPVEPADRLPCAEGATWVEARPRTVQEVPLCLHFRVKVVSTAKVPLLVGGAVLSSDGGIYGFVDEGNEPLQPGQSREFPTDRSKAFLAGLPPDVSENVAVFGTQTNNPVPWNLLTSPVVQRGQASRGNQRGEEKTGTLARALERYLLPGTRGTTMVSVVEDGTWTKSSITYVVRANSGFTTSPSGVKQTSTLDKREYTITNFDIRPYLPNDESTALARVLRVADSLSKYSQFMQDGVGYKQHPWTEKTDADNLKKGIDCSRAIWFAFTRAGLPYNHRGDAYIPTAEMVNTNGLMSDQFDSCQGKSIELGDVLVYRDDVQGDGHTVMAIDPVKRIAWGSHGWDGNVKVGKPSDTGVEYQLIKYKTDWDRWDRRTMTQKACWRYRHIAEEVAMGSGLPGLDALRSCVQQACRRSDRPDPAFLNIIQVVRP